MDQLEVGALVAEHDLVSPSKVATIQFTSAEPYIEVELKAMAEPYKAVLLS